MHKYFQERVTFNAAKELAAWLPDQPTAAKIFICKTQDKEN
jgi:hypothetical protein